VGARKRKTLPSVYDELMEAHDLPALQRMYETCDANAYSLRGKETPLFDNRASDDFCRWLVQNGTEIDWVSPSYFATTALHSRASAWRGDVDVLIELGASLELTDRYGCTALRRAAGNQKVDSVRSLVRAGADVHGADHQGTTPLEAALTGLAPARITDAAEVVDELLAAGATITDACRAGVWRAGVTFEQRRDRYNPEELPSTEESLAWLYQSLSVPPAPRAHRPPQHDGTSRIVLVDGPWKRRSEDLWDRLVPDSGPARTLQGEAVRIAGKVARELLDNGGTNWGTDFVAMLDSLERLFHSHNALDAESLARAEIVIADARRRNAKDVEFLAEAAVEWVARNPQSIELADPGLEG
jgi:hypothetical protein